MLNQREAQERIRARQRRPEAGSRDSEAGSREATERTRASGLGPADSGQRLGRAERAEYISIAHILHNSLSKREYMSLIDYLTQTV